MNSAITHSVFSVLLTGAFLFPAAAECVPNSHVYASRQEVASSGTLQKTVEDKSMSECQTGGENKNSMGFPKPARDELPGPLKVIVIDPGHGGLNEGAVGTAHVHEKHLTLQVALLAADRLRERMPDVRVVLTRQRDEFLSLNERIEIANKLHADLFLSLHFNSSDNEQAAGFESFWVHNYWENDMNEDGVEVTDEIRTARARSAALGYRMADKFNHAMHKRFRVTDRGVKPGNYTVLTRAEVPAVVLEFGFLSHDVEGIEATTRENRDRYVNALVDAVQRYADISDGVKDAAGGE